MDSATGSNDAALLEALRSYAARVESIDPVRCSGVVSNVVGLLVESDGPSASLGDICEIRISENNRVRTQVVGFRANRVLGYALDSRSPKV